MVCQIIDRTLFSRFTNKKIKKIQTIKTFFSLYFILTLVIECLITPAIANPIATTIPITANVISNTGSDAPRY